MGYDVHITRAQDWTESELAPIPKGEWASVVGADPELGPDPENGADDFLFLAHPDEPAPLWWKAGLVYTKDPDRYTIRKMIELAERLGARVQGDEGQVYTEWERYDQLRANAWPNRPAQKPSFWARLFGR